jgi:hypothetical protein
MNRRSFEENQPPQGIEPEDGLERDITVYLAQIGFIDRVMTDILDAPGKIRKTLLWAGFCLFNLFLLVVFGTNPSLIAGFFALQEDLGEFFFLFLGMTLLGGLTGLILVSDISWLKGYLPKPDPLYDE